MREAVIVAHEERCLGSQRLYEGRILNLRRDQVELENGARSDREVIEHNGGVCVAALDPQGKLLLVRQYRYPYGKELLELPAGKREKDEDPMVCGARELEEETGYRAESLEKLGELYPTPAYDTEIIHIYLARGLTPSRQHLDENEFLDVVPMDFEEALGMVMRGEIPDAKTQIGILKMAMLRQGKE